MNTIATLKKDFINITKLRLFEVEVVNKETNDTDYIIFNIELHKNTLYAFHESLNIKQQKSKKIAFVKVVLDSCFSLDEHLQDLYSNCIDAICESEFFELSNN